MKTVSLKEDVPAVFGGVLLAGTKCELVEENAHWNGWGAPAKQDRINLIRFEDKEAVVMNNQIRRL